MDAPFLMAALAGAVAGLLASAVPGFHVNALAILALALAPAAGEPGAGFLVAALVASPFGQALSSPWLGGTTDDLALQGLPATRLAREGRAGEAVALQVWGAFAGVVFALPLALAVRPIWLLLTPHLPRLMPWLLLAVVALLVSSERARLAVHPRRERVGPRETWVFDKGPFSGLAGKAAALLVLGLAGALGLAAFRLGAASPWGLPASPLLPLLAGLFGVPALLDLLASTRRFTRAKMRAPRPPRGEIARAAMPGAAASSLLGLAPGVSGSHAALLLPKPRDPERALLQAAAVNGGGVVFTLLAWHALGKARSGALVAAETLAPPIAWRSWAPPAEVAREAALVIAVAALACLLARALSRPMSRAASALGPRRMGQWGLALLLASVLAFNGALGVLVLATAGAIGMLPKRWGLRRSHAMGVILVPALLWAWGLA